MTCWIKTDSQSMALSSLRSWLSILVPFCLISQMFIRAVAFVTDELFLLYSTPEISVSIWSMGLSLKIIEKYVFIFFIRCKQPILKLKNCIRWFRIACWHLINGIPIDFAHRIQKPIPILGIRIITEFLTKVHD